MANRETFPLRVPRKNETQLVLAYFDGNTTSSPTSYETYEISSVTRTAIGVHDVVFRHKYPLKVAPLVTTHGTATSGIHTRVSAWDAAAGTLSVVTSKVPPVPAWTTAITVTAHAATLARAGYVVGVTATTATSAGGKIMQSTAAPGAGFVQVAYSAAGVATLTFNAADNVTVASALIADAGNVDLATTDRVYISLVVRNTSRNV